MLPIIGKRVVTSVMTIIATTIVVFALRYILPGGPIADILGRSGGIVTPAEIQAIKVRIGLNHSVVVQYWLWIDGVVHGNFGTSYYSQEPVSRLVIQALPPSLELIIGALIICVVGGGALGIYMAVKRQSRIGRVLLNATGLGLAIPDFWIATIVAGVVGLGLKLLPPVGFVPLSASVIGNVKTMIMPVVVLSMITGAFIARHMFNSMSEVLNKPFVRSGWAMGLSARTIYWKWALRSAVIPVITFIPVAVAALISGTVLMETVFNIPGIGTLIVQSVLNEDYPTVQAIVLGAAIVVAVLNLIADLVIGILDPRSRI